jgi:predicted Zn-dependent peptidase
MAVQLGPDVQRPGTTRTLTSDTDGGLVKRTVLPNGVRVLSESVAGVRSVAFGVWVGVGSRDESPSLAGASHYLEHLLFKGTPRRGALEISAALDAVGGELNAFTTKEFTCYYARVLDTDLPLAVDVVVDMVTSSLLRSPDVEAERAVILDEIAMHDDDPGDAVHDALAAAIWGTGPLGRPVLGTVSSISSLRRTAIARHYRSRYQPASLVVAAAGRLEHGRLVRLVKSAFTAAGLDAEAVPAPARQVSAPPPFRSTVRVARRPIEQANLVLAAEGISRTDDRRFALGVLNGALGGGMSSRLFQEIREKRGLAYSVYSYTSQYADTGLLGVYAGCLPAKAGQVLSLCREEIERVARAGLTAEELDRGKGQLVGGLVLGLEDTGSRMSRLAKAELVYRELLTVDEIINRLTAVTMDEVRTVAAEVLSGQLALAVIGPFDEDDFADAVA